MKKLFGLLLFLFSFFLFATETFAIGTGPVVIHHVYGGGGNTSAPYESDFVVLQNTSASTVNLSGWILENGAATSTLPLVGRNITLSGTIPAGGFYLIEITTNTNAGIPLSDHTIPNLIATYSTSAGGMGNNNNKLRLLDNASNVVDFIGWGTTTNQALVGGVVTNGGLTAPNTSNTGSIIRTFTSGSNNTDFVIQNLNCGAHSSTVCLLYINQHLVTFQDRDTSFLSSGLVYYGNGATAPANPIRTGYTFSGWNTEFSFVTGTMTIVGEYNANTYDVSFDVNNGTGIMNNQSFVYDTAQNLTGNLFTRVGYTFSGWNTLADGSGTGYTDNSNVLNLTTTSGGIITLYAQRTLNTYLVTFVDRDSTVLSTGIVDHGSGAIAPANPTRTGYTFSGWNSDFSTITGVMIVTGEYTINQYTISFDTDGGTTIASITDDYGTGIIAPVNPTKTGYTFSGWVPTIPATMPAMDVIVTGQWNINSYTLSYTGGGADGGSAPTSQTGDYNTSLLLAANTFTRTGYTFSGWDCGMVGSGYTITMNTVCTAQWTLNTYLVTFTDRNSTVLSTGMVNHGSGATAPANPTRTGYTFSGWNMDFTNITGTKTITAEYTINQYTLSYVAGTGGVVVGSGMQSVPYLGTGTSVTVQAQTGYRFISWSDGKNQPTRIDGGVTGNRMVTAQFILIPSSGLPSSITPQTTNTTPPGNTPTSSEENGEDQIDNEIIDSPILTQEDKQRIFNPSFTQSCFDYKDEKTIDQGVEVSETFIDAHQLFFSYSLTKRQGTRDYRPFSTITREEAARFFVEFAKNVLCRKPNYTYTAQFSDIGDADTTLASFIEASYEFGIFHGDGGKNLLSEQSRTFRPKALMTQDELAAVIVRLVTNEYDETAGDDRSNAYKIFLKNYAKTQLNSSKRDTIAEVVYDVYRWNEYTLEDIGYVIKK